MQDHIYEILFLHVRFTYFLRLLAHRPEDWNPNSGISIFELSNFEN